METEMQTIKDDLRFIKEELIEIKSAMPDKDMFLDAEEAKLLAESFMHEKEGKLTSSKDLKKELGL